jgi:ERF superfamily
MTVETDVRSWEVDLVDALSKLDDVPREKTADTGSYSYTYADLASILGYVRPLLAEHGFVITQPVGGPVGEVSVGTVLFHRSGSTFVSPLLSAKVSGTPQAIGSTITYLRRYSLLATLGLATEDDDGAAGTRQPAAPRKRTTTTRAPAREKSPEERLSARVFALFGDLGYRDRDDRLLFTSQILGREVTSWNDLDDGEKRRVCDYLEAEVEGPSSSYDEMGG